MGGDSCRGCIRARMEGGYALPGSPACLGCRRAFAGPAKPDLWLAGPPGGTAIAADDRGICYAVAVPDGLRWVLAAVAALLFALWAGDRGTALLAAAAATGTGLSAAVFRATGGIRHYWGVWGERVWHVVGIGRLSVARAYPADAIRAFHCAGPRAGGPVAFHHGRVTVRVAMLPAPADNEWLMLRLNEHLAASRGRRP